MAGFIKVVVALMALVASIAAGGDSIGASGAAANRQAGDDGKLPGPHCVEPAARDADRGAARARCRSDEHHLCGALDLPDREPARRAHRHRLQRLRQAERAARHRHHEPRAHYALHRPSRSAHSACAARLGAEPGPAGAPRRAGARRARAQRADQYPRLGRGGTERHGNSIFIFEIANLCIGISATCTTRSTSSSSTRSAASMSCSRRSTAR